MRKILIFSSLLLFFSCVPQRKFLDTKEKGEQYRQENVKCQERLKVSLARNADYEKEISELKTMINELKEDTNKFATEYRRIHRLNKELDVLYEKVISQNKNLLAASSARNQKLQLELESKQRELDTKEERLMKLDEDLDKKEKNIDKLAEDLNSREAKVRELESLISRKDSAVNSLKKKITDALLGFKESELTVEMKDGKVYVSLSEQLLFKSGSRTVDPKGKDALSKLATVLNANKDINILIEGHTDNVPIAGGSIKDNWDLSVLRATSIVKILSEDYKLDPKRIMAAGRGEFLPKSENDSAEGRSQNRRTEIILTPKLDELLQLLESEE